MPTITIHRGAHTIGGSCIEVSHGGHRLLLDLGMPLMAAGGGTLSTGDLAHPSLENGILPPVHGLYQGESPNVTGLLISHAHMDHYGLLDKVHPGVPVYVSRGTRTLIDIGRIFYPEGSKVRFDEFSTFDHWKPFQLGPFTITSHLMDHSGYDACGFLIEVGGKRIFYSGDFRGHGRKSKLLTQMIRRPIPDLDCLIMEGTTLGGNHHVGFENENEVEQAFFHHFSSQKDVTWVAASGSNVDRLVSLYRASKRAGKTLVLDLYTFYLLVQLKKITPGLPPFPGDHIRIFYLRGHAQNMVDHLGKQPLYEYRPRKIELDEIAVRREKMVVKLPISGMKKIAGHLEPQQPFNGARLIYSMWQGYLEGDSAYSDFCARFNAELTQVHVSGHAYLADLKALVQALNPKQVIPVHTLCRDEFPTHFKSVTLLEEGVPLSL